MDATGVVQPLAEALTSLAAVDPDTLSDAAVRDALLALLTCEHRLDAVIGRFVGVFDDRRLSHRDGFGSTKQWLIGFGRLSGSAAGGRMRATEVTRLLPELAEAFAAGEVSAEHVNRIGLTAEEVGDEVIEQAEHTLVDLAQQANPEHLQEACGHLRDLALADRRTPPEEQYRRRGLTLSRLGDMWRLRGVLDTETGALFGTALDAFTKPPGQGDDRSPAQRRHDATADMLNAVLRSGQAPEVAGGRPTIGLLMPVQRYLKLHDHNAGAAAGRASSDGGRSTGGGLDEGGAAEPGDAGPGEGLGRDRGGDGAAVMAGWGPVPDELAARLSCDATLQQLWLHPANGLPLHLGRAYRNTPTPLRRALAARDPYCRWPGCRIPANWCDSHHLQEWIRDHGETNVDNLVLLCRYHHVCMHERGWELHREASSGWIWIRRPDGRRYELGPSRPRVDATPLGTRREPVVPGRSQRMEHPVPDDRASPDGAVEARERRALHGELVEHEQAPPDGAEPPEAAQHSRPGPDARERRPLDGAAAQGLDSLPRPPEANDQAGPREDAARSRRPAGAARPRRGPSRSGPSAVQGAESLGLRVDLPTDPRR